MKVKITSDGTPRGTRLVCAETGETIEQVGEIVWRAKPCELPYATVRFLFPRIDVSSEANREAVVKDSSQLGKEWKESEAV